MRVVALQATRYSPILICHAQYFTQTCKTPVISNVQKFLPGSEKSESSSAKFAAPSPLPEPTAIMKTGTNVKTNACTETSPIFLNKSHKTPDKIVSVTEKE